jgi:hypothetical protein
MKLKVFKYSKENLIKMKIKITLLTTLCFLLLTNRLKAQTPPNAFNYSAVANNAAGLPIASTTIGIQMTILKTSTIGATQYTENHFVITDSYGVFNLVIGTGVVQSGSMTAIDWSTDNYFLKVGMDTAGGTNFQTMGITQFLSVPYALYAKSAGSVSGVINETDSIFVASIANGITGADTTNWNNKQDHLSAGTNFTISGDSISAAASNSGCFSHYIGEVFGGGIIFHLWKDAQGVEHGLIIDKTYLSTGYVWSNMSTWNAPGIGAAAESRWNGLGNSNAIVAQVGHTTSAAALCLNSTNGGQNDWYLPSIEELSLIYNKYYIISRALSQIPGASQLQDSKHWSSSELSFPLSPISNQVQVAYSDFAQGDVYNYEYKNQLFYVRAIRAF